MKHDISLMKSILGKNFTKRNRFTRQCIGESIIALMGNKAFEDITISDIVKKAGVSRMTFYHYFQSKTDALNSYLHEIIELYLEECSRSIGIDTFYDAVLLLTCQAPFSQCGTHSFWICPVFFRYPAVSSPLL